MVHIVILGTCDTKLEELLFLRSRILAAAPDQQASVTLVDVGRTVQDHPEITVRQDTVAKAYGSADLGSLERGAVIRHMAGGATSWLRQALEDGRSGQGKAVHGVIGAGGTGNTALISKVMQDACPIGLPKLIVSTAASGETGPFVGESDITLMYSVVDIAGMNSLLQRILNNAAGAIVGMALAYERSLTETNGPDSDNSTRQRRKKVGLTMFGVTTPCVDAIRTHLETNYPVECFVFHCTGHGGRAMEALVEKGELDAVVDLTTTEICDHVAGGVMSAGEHRLEASLEAGIPYIISLGATDMVNFGATVPERYQGRQFIEHNPTVTLMRTNQQETEAVAQFIADKILHFAKDKRKVEILLPLKGVSMLAVDGQPFYSPEADAALRDCLKSALQSVTDSVKILEEDLAINDEQFAIKVAEEMAALMQLESKS